MRTRRRFLVSRAERILTVPTVGRVAAGLAGARRHGQILVFHHISDDRTATPSGVVPSVPREILREQINVLLNLGQVVSLERLIEDRPWGARPGFALTFDDDAVTHHDVVLPLLAELGVPATFFICGRSLVKLGPPWFEVLDALIRERGVDHAVRVLGTSPRSSRALATWCEGDPAAQRILESGELGVDVPQLDERQIRAIAAAGMAVGFHTLSHRAMPGLSDDELDLVITQGRSDIEDAIGGPVRLFAYPHGSADRRVAERVRAAGYVAGVTGRQQPIRRGTDPFLLGRWEPGSLAASDFLARVAANTNGWAGR